jgi:hypothetical protein
VISECLIKKLNVLDKRILFLAKDKNYKHQRHIYHNSNVMKKKLEADLVSIAHRILQLKNKSDINQLFLETQKLYEKLSVLRFVNEHYGASRPTIGHAEMEKEIEAFYDKSPDLPVETMIEMTEFIPLEKVPATEEISTVEPITADLSLKETLDEEADSTAAIEETNDTKEEGTSEDPAVLNDFAADITEKPLEDIETIEKEEEKIADELATVEENDAVLEEVNNVDDFSADIVEQTLEDIQEETKKEPATEFKPAFELTDSTDLETPKRAQTMQISFEDLLGGHYSEPDFVKVDDVKALPPEVVFEAVEKKEAKKTPPPIAAEIAIEAKTVSLNDKFSKGIEIDLNDRIAFVKHLFGNSSEDYNRVLNQLITFDNFYETRNFIEEMVKPDYNNWNGKDDYAERFMDIIEKKFL